MYNSEYFVKKLNLAPHPEGGYFREIYKSNHWINADQISNRYQGERSLASTIYFLLEAGQVSKFHRLKADEIMFYHYGSALALHMIDEEGAYSVAILGLDVEKGEMPQVILPAGVYFCGIPVDRRVFSLISTMVSPAFEYKDFQLFTTGEMCKLFPHLRGVVEPLIPDD